jgi:flavin reductase ActVB
LASKLDKTDFTNALGQFASGITVVITADGHGGFAGFTASAFSSLSLEPPLVLVCLQKDADCHQAFMEADQFTVSILSSDQADIGLRFSTKSIDKMQGTPAVPGEATGLPLVERASGWLECRAWGRYDGGDHTILIGEVLAAGVSNEEPLLRYRRGFGRFAPAQVT